MTIFLAKATPMLVFVFTLAAIVKHREIRSVKTEMTGWELKPNTTQCTWS